MFYQTGFERPLNQPGQPPTSNFGISNRPVYVDSSLVIVSSFDQITNQAMLMAGTNFEGMGFTLYRGASNYFIDFDCESHNLNTSDRGISIAVPLLALRIVNGGLLDNHNVLHPIGWTDDQVHHVHAEINEAGPTWSFQLDNDPPLIGDAFSYGDEFGIYLTLSSEENPAEPPVQVAIDNLRIGTTDTLPPLQLLHWFTRDEGTQPRCQLVRTKDGSLYGTTEFSGFDYTNGQGSGSVFKFNTNGAMDWVCPFHETDGARPLAGVVLGEDGYLYGTTSEGGAYGQGTAFKMTTGGKLVWSVPFNGQNGSTPSKELVQVGPLLYGTTPSGGTTDLGTVFTLTRDGTITTIHSFTGGADGGQPLCRLLPSANGKIYGTTSTGGSAPASGGTVFDLRRNGKLTTLFSFNRTNGYAPWAGLIETSPGTFYGTTDGGGAFKYGTVFRITSGGKFKLLHSFSGTEGAFPDTELVRGKDGALYGTTYLGGDSPILYSFGTLFRITPTGAVTRLFEFHGGDGSFPESALTVGNDGNLYGTTLGGYESTGNIFSFPIGRPCLIIASPVTNARFFRPNIEISGRTKSDPPVTNVLYQLNGGPWKPAATTNAWANWTANVILKPGENTVRAYAVNQSGISSRTYSVSYSLTTRPF
jgi:uncharacterized repeat protein (TIGR03803 family)